MSAKIIKERTRKEDISYSLNYDLYDDGGFSFPCDEDGNVIIRQMSGCAIFNYESCKKSGVEPYVRKNVSRYTENAEAICECGNHIELYDEYMGACECPHCGRWHNLFGQTLKNPERWEMD